jgi:phosphoglycolate/pyridoxal phosphate phosphatase family enzyme
LARQIDGFIFDLDGTVYLGEKALPGAVEAIDRLRKMEKLTLFVSNKPLESRAAYASKLTRLGIPAAPDDVITSAFVLGYHLAKTEPHLNLYVVGEENLVNELREHGLNVVNEFLDQDSMQVIEPHGVDAVVVAFDRTLTYRKLNTAYQALKRGAKFYATNADKACPMPGGDIPDAGGTIAALEKMTGRQIDLLAGKPSMLITQVALQRLELPAECVMMVGDRLETDIFMGQQAGMSTAVTLTGVTKREDVAKIQLPPDYIIENLGDLPAIVSNTNHVAK